MMSLMKHISKSPHRSPRKGEVSDSLKTNVRDLKKLFDKKKLATEAFNRDENSPYFQHKYQHQWSQEDMV